MKKNKIMKIAILALFSAVLLAPSNVEAASSNPYNSWKTTAINYPDSGQLVPAGPITITWDEFDIDDREVIGYEVFLDNVIQDTAIIDEGDTFSCEIYTTKVSQHQVKVLAQLKNNIKISTNVRNFYVSKKGMGFHSSNGYSTIQDAKNMGLSWYYNWGTAPTYTGECPNQKLDFVPMIWGAYSGSNEQLTTIKNAGYKTVLGYNEPDFVDQSNVPIETAITNQKYFTDSNLRVGSPASAIGAPNSKWFNEYWNGINHDDIDFIPIHNYPGNVGKTDDEIKNNAKAFLQLVSDTYTKFNKPVWITEFAVANWDYYWDGYNGANEENKAQVESFMNYVINGFDGNKGLDDLEYVERYAWFSFDALDRYGGDSGLFNTKSDNNKNNNLTVGSLTKLGNLYRNLGNPDNYVLPSLDGVITNELDDEYIDDYVKVIINGEEKNIKFGDKLDRLDPILKEGYAFKGWYKDQNYSEEFDFDKPIVNNTTIYAKWNKLFKVEVDGKEELIEEGLKFPRPDSPKKEGYVFKGWYKDRDYNKEFDFDEPIVSNATIYAKWNKLYKVEVDGSENLVEEGQKFIRPKTPIKQGYTFGGWYIDDTYTNEFNFNLPITQDTVIFIKWVRNNPVTEYINVTVDGTTTQIIKGTKLNKPNQPHKDGYIFKGWYSDQEYRELFDFDQLLMNDVIIYTRWIEDTNSGNDKIVVIENEKMSSSSVDTGDDMEIRNNTIGLFSLLGIVMILKRKYN